jgi:hypothetical protein
MQIFHRRVSGNFYGQDDHSRFLNRTGLNSAKSITPYQRGLQGKKMT